MAFTPAQIAARQRHLDRVNARAFARRAERLHRMATQLSDLANSVRADTARFPALKDAFSKIEEAGQRLRSAGFRYEEAIDSLPPQ